MVCHLHCSWLSTTLNNIVTQQYCSILLITMSNVGSRTLLQPVLLQAHKYWLCSHRTEMKFFLLILSHSQLLDKVGCSKQLTWISFELKIHWKWNTTVVKSLLANFSYFLFTMWYSQYQFWWDNAIFMNERLSVLTASNDFVCVKFLHNTLLSEYNLGAADL